MYNGFREPWILWKRLCGWLHVKWASNGPICPLPESSQQFHLIITLRLSRVLDIVKIVIESNQTHVHIKESERNNECLIAYASKAIFLLPYFFLIKKHLS